MTSWYQILFCQKVRRFLPNAFVWDDNLDKGGRMLLARKDMDFPITIIDEVR